MEELKKRVLDVDNKEKKQSIDEINNSRYKLKIRDILKNNIIFFEGVFLLVFKGLIFNGLINIGIEFGTVLYTIVASLLLMCPIINCKNKFAYIYLNIVYAVVTFIIYSDFLYYSYSTNLLSFYQIENIKYSDEIGNGLTYIIDISNLLVFWIDNILLLLFSVISYRYTNKTVYKNRKLKAILIFSIVLLNVVVIIGSVNDVYESRICNKSLIVQGSSIYYYHYEDLKDYLSNMFIKGQVDEEKLMAIYNKNIDEKDLTTEYTGIAKDYNVIILQLESLNEYIIGKTVNGKEITPNLNRFFNNNIYCSNMYNQGLGTTADSEFEMENSMYPLENGYVFQKYYVNAWKDIYTTLRKNGYYTSFMHPNNSTYWNREEVYNVGYNIDEYNDIKKFPNIEQAGAFYSDEGFYEEAVNIMNSYEGKFCTTLVSVTTHVPFSLDGISDLENKLTITKQDVEKYNDELFENYIISCNFSDYAFGKFIEKLEETGLMDKSILIVYSDHGEGLIGKNEIKSLYEDNGMDYNDFEYFVKDVHVPFGIKIPNLDKKINIQRAVSKIDIKPTILDLLEIKDDFSIGSSIFSRKNYSFIKGLGYITSDIYCINEKFYDKNTLQEINGNEYLVSLLKKMEDEIYLSDTIIKNNLLK